MKSSTLKPQCFIVPAQFFGQQLATCEQQVLPNPALNLAPFGRWTLRDKAAQRRLVLRYVARERAATFRCTSVINRLLAEATIGSSLKNFYGTMQTMRCLPIPPAVCTWRLLVGLVGTLMLGGCIPEEYGDKACFGSVDGLRLQQNQQRVGAIFHSYGFRIMTSDVRNATVFDLVYVPEDCPANVHCGRYFIVRWDAERNVLVLAYSQSEPLTKKEKVVFEAISTKIMDTEKVWPISPEHCGLRLVSGRYAF